jgi:voltage-gated potassium channel
MLMLLLSGTFFYASTENWSYRDSLHFCVMTMSTIGYGDFIPTTNLTKIFTIIYSLISIGVFVGVVSKLAQVMIQGKHRKHNSTESS